MEVAKNTLRVFMLLVLVWWCNTAHAQNDRARDIEQKLLELADSAAVGLNQKVEATVSKVSLSEFIRGLAISNNLNISVDPALDLKITVNFTNENIVNILVFLVKQYNLDITFTGSIMYISQYTPPPPDRAPPKEINAAYNSTNDQLSLDVQNDTLYQVVKKITQLSGKNVNTSPDVRNQVVSAFIQELPFEKGLEQFAFSNQLQVSGFGEGVYTLTKAGELPKGVAINNNEEVPEVKRGIDTPPVIEHEFYLQMDKDVNGQHLITLAALNASLLDLIKIIAQESGISYFIFSEPEGTTTVNVQDMPLDEFLNLMFMGKEYAYKNEKGVYLFGSDTDQGFTSTKFIQLQYRSTDIVIENIPAEMKKGLEIKAFPELNSLIASGPSMKLNELDLFIREIDKLVPIIMIEVIIIDVSRSRSVSTGIEAGLSDDPVTTNGTILPGANLTFSSSSVNNLLDFVNGAGIVNIGQVAPNFYASIKALEEQGVLKVRSTPKLSTLNGHEATMSIGQTDYYVVETNNVIGSQNPQNIVTRSFESVQADFALTINPVVSGDDYVTLEISVDQSDFTQRISPDAPPGSATRSFQSLIRVKNEEIIVLGGLEEQSLSHTGSGFPLLSRIPVLKWLFSNREKSKSNTKLNIFIKPTIVY